MGTRGKRRIQRTELPKDLYDHISKTLPNVQEDKIIQFLYDMRYAKTSDISKYLGLSLVQTRVHLRRLYKDWYLFRKFRKVDRGSSEGYYYLDKASIYYLAANAEQTIREFGWDNRYNISDPEKMDHTLDITQIRVVLQCESEINGVVLDKFYGEKRAGLRKINEELSLNPDGEFALIVKYNESRFLKKYLLEYDRGTEDLVKIKAKISKYSQYYKSDDCLYRYEDYKPDLLIVCNGSLSEKRVRIALDNNPELMILCKVFIVQLTSIINDPYGHVYYEMESERLINLIDIDMKNDE